MANVVWSRHVNGDLGSKESVVKGVSRPQVAISSAPQSHHNYSECGMSMKIPHFRPSGLRLEVLRYLDRGTEKRVLPPAPHG